MYIMSPPLPSHPLLSSFLTCPSPFPHFPFLPPLSFQPPFSSSSPPSSSILPLPPPSLPPLPSSSGNEELANRTPEWKESLPKNATALRGRRGAMHVRQAKTEEIKGHRFVKRFFRRAIYCSLCHEFLWYVLFKMK